jgi:hypothetical protein
MLPAKVVIGNMAQELVYTTTLRLNGPWLLETKQLLALDEILEQIRPHDSGAADRVPENRKSLTILLSKERELKSSSFKEAMTHIASQNEVARGFAYTATDGNTTALVRRIPQWDKKNDGEAVPFFEIKVSPASSSISYEIFGELRNWADSVEAPLWRQWLLFNFRFMFRVGLLFPVVAVLLTLFNTSPGPTEFKDALKQQARTLLHDGINQQNQTKALELVLALESDYIPEGTKPPRAQMPIAGYLVAIYVLGFLSFTPTLCMAIWAGKRRLRWWNLWLNFNTVTIPTLVLARWVYPQVFSALEAALRH